jgi:hypothetical protein
MIQIEVVPIVCLTINRTVLVRDIGNDMRNVKDFLPRGPENGVCQLGGAHAFTSDDYTLS